MANKGESGSRRARVAAFGDIISAAMKKQAAGTGGGQSPAPVKQAPKKVKPATAKTPQVTKTRSARPADVVRQMNPVPERGGLTAESADQFNPSEFHPDGTRKSFHELRAERERAWDALGQKAAADREAGVFDNGPEDRPHAGMTSTFDRLALYAVEDGAVKGVDRVAVRVTRRLNADMEAGTAEGQSSAGATQRRLRR